ncbi:MAG TPA: inositol monophosphatase family protein [Syntrophales bacterium]|nr:inositol monophosphatase family protein [Syntrophales bacterium]
MTEYGKFAVSIAKEAGAILKERFKEKHEIDYKGEIDIVTEADRMSETILVSEIGRKFPDHNILSEESTEVWKGSSYRWIIDPLDGTTNYAHGFPVFCISIALEKDGAVICGVVHNPVSEELFVAEKGGGAFVNGSAISVSQTTEISESLLATGFPYDIRRDPNNNINYFSEMALEAQAIRRAGSAALDLAYTAMGRFDGFWELKLHQWDTAAGWLIVCEAGGIVTDISGNSYHLDSPSIVASNRIIHDSMIRILNRINPFDKRLL